MWRINEASWVSTAIRNHSAWNQSQAKERAARGILKYTWESRATVGQAYTCKVTLALSHFPSQPIRPQFCKRRIFLKFPPHSFSFKSFLSSFSSSVTSPTNLPLLLLKTLHFYSSLPLFNCPFILTFYLLEVPSSILTSPSFLLQFTSPPLCASRWVGSLFILALWCMA